MQDTIDRIVEASVMPFSIVIVGVGGADFKMMVKTLFFLSRLMGCYCPVLYCSTYWMLMKIHFDPDLVKSCHVTLFSSFHFENSCHKRLPFPW